MTTHDILVLLNLILLESMLSVDNAAVLAVMVKDLPEKQKNQALRYGLLGAYVFRGLSLFFVSYLMDIWILKVIGGLYLVWLAIGHFTKKNDTIEEVSDKKDSKIFNLASSIGLSKFWSTVILVEIMDMAFSVDNVFAAVAMTDKIWLILTGVFIGILAMRFVAGVFTKLMNKYPALENSAFYVILLLGLKLVISEALPKGSAMEQFVNSHAFDLYFSIAMIGLFMIPILNSKKQKA